MKISPIALAVALLFAVAVGFFIGRGTVAEPQTAQATEQNDTPAAAEPTESTPSTPTPPAAGEVAPGDSEAAVAATTDNTVTAPDAPTAPEATAPTRSGPVAPLAGNILPPVKMGISDDKLTEVLSSIAAKMEAEKLAYVSKDLQDCSGIFHQIKDRLQRRLPALKGGEEYAYPTVNPWRSSRRIADWYYQQGNLLIVKDPVASKNSIRPGSVMFFGRAGEIFRNLNIDMLTDRDNKYTKNGAIQHIAVVTAVQKDAEGNVVSYDMMHARYPGGPPASRSGSREVQSNSAANKAKVAPYPFGHWTQQWVAVANIATPAAQGATASTGK